jgi:hypothetical protein
MEDLKKKKLPVPAGDPFAGAIKKIGGKGSYSFTTTGGKSKGASKRGSIGKDYKTYRSKNPSSSKRGRAADSANKTAYKGKKRGG